MAFDGDLKPHSESCQKRALKWKQRGDKRLAEQQQHMLLWQTIAELFYPERADFTSQWAGGDERYKGIYTSQPQQMRRDLSTTLGAMLRPRGRRWFRMVVRPDGLMQSDDVKRWCETATDKQWSVVYDPRANFARAMSESDADYVTFGNSVLAHTYNMNQDGVFF
ncbi:MAG: portal protein, partial [Pseudomonadota bacterium]